MYTELRRRRFQGYSRLARTTDVKMSSHILGTSTLSQKGLFCCGAVLMWPSVCFQILYANEGECRKEADMETVPQGEKTNCLPHKGHEFIPTLYHFPSNCEACAKPLWHVFKPPPALECRRCHVKCHKDHLDKKEDVIAPCKGKVNFLDSQSCCELILLRSFFFFFFFRKMNREC